MRRALEYVLSSSDGVIAQHAQDPQLAGPGASPPRGRDNQEARTSGAGPPLPRQAWSRETQIAELYLPRLHICYVCVRGDRRCHQVGQTTRHHRDRGGCTSSPHAERPARWSGYDPTYKVNPPLRPDEHVEAVREALADGTIDAVATDHAPHARHDKEHAFAEAAFGMLGLETALAVVLETMINSARMNWSELAKRMSIMPAHIARLADQDVPWFPVNRPISYSRRSCRPARSSTATLRPLLSRNNPWHGRELPDPVVATIWAGQITYQKQL